MQLRIIGLRVFFLLFLVLNRIAVDNSFAQVNKDC